MSADKNHSDLQPAAKEAANKRIKLLTLAFLFSEKRDQILLGNTTIFNAIYNKNDDGIALNIAPKFRSVICSMED